MKSKKIITFAQLKEKHIANMVRLWYIKYIIFRKWRTLSMYCGKCGKEITDINLPCPHCGDKTIRYEKPPVIREESVLQKPQRKKSVLFEPTKRKNRGIFILIIVATAIAFFYNSTDGSKSPEDAVEKLTEAFQSYNVNQMIEFTTYNETCQKALGNSQYNISELKNQLEGDYKNRARNDGKKKITVTSIYKLDGEALEEMSDRLTMFFNDIKNIEEIDVVETKETSDSEEKERKYYCLKVGGRWYVSIELLQSDLLV